MASDDMNHFKKYLEARLNDYLPRPELHANLIDVYEKHRKMINEDPDKYYSESGDMFDIMQAEQLDIAAGMISLYKKLGFDENEKAYTEFYSAVKNSTGHADIMGKLGAARDKAGIVLKRNFSTQNALLSLVTCVISLLSCIPEEISGKESVVFEEWIKFREIHPEAEWKWIVNSSYRNCLWYDDERLQIIGSRLNEVIKKYQ